MLEYDGALIVVSHDREFLEGLCNRTIEFRDQKLYEYLGDVSYFLEKRQLENMRQVELQTAASAASVVPEVRTPASREDRKRVQRAVQQAEKKIERLEAEIAAIEQQMADPDFYNRPDAGKITQTYSGTQAALEEAMAEWENAQSELDSLE